MSRSSISNLKILLDEHGAILPNLPKQVKTLTQHILPLIANVTNAGATDIIPCWKKINRKRCPGKIAAGIELSNMDILWQCLVCGDHGSISNWQKTIWDGLHR